MKGQAMELDKGSAQELLDQLATARSLASSGGSAQQAAPHHSAARRDLAAGVAATRTEAATLRDQAIRAGVIDETGRLTPAATAAGVSRANATWRYRP